MASSRTISSPLKNRSWRFWVVVGYIMIVVIFCAFWAWSLFSPLNNALISEQTDNLTAIANAGALSLETSSDDAETLARALVADTGHRATIIALDGTVIGDSMHDATTLENHNDRPEVMTAETGAKGSDVRMSATENIMRIYVAVPATYEGTQVVLRISSPFSSISTLTRSIRTTGLLLLVGGMVIAAFIAWRTLRSASQPVHKLEKVRSDFVANASHELKTPVAGIRLLSETIEQSCEDGDLETTRAFAERLDGEAERLQHLVVDLLDLSRLENETDNPSARTDVHAAVSTSFEAHRKLAHAKRLIFTFDDRIEPSRSCYANMDASDASLIIDNLLDNAISYTEQGFIQVRLDIDDDIRLQVVDSGIGIPAVDQSRIFERFYRVDTARSRESGGTGLGLSLVRHAVKRGGGTIEVQSVPGEGTTFTVSLPVARP